MREKRDAERFVPDVAQLWAVWSRGEDQTKRSLREGASRGNFYSSHIASANRTALKTLNPRQERLWVGNCAVGTGARISSVLCRLSTLLKRQGERFLNIQWGLAVFAADVCGENLFATGIQQYAPSILIIEKYSFWRPIVPNEPVPHMNVKFDGLGMIALPIFCRPSS